MSSDKQPIHAYVIDVDTPNESLIKAKNRSQVFRHLAIQHTVTMATHEDLDRIIRKDKAEAILDISEGPAPGP